MRMKPTFGSAIETCADLSALFENEGEWEAAERVRVLLYYLLRGQRSAAHRILGSLDSADAASTVASESAIRRRIVELGLFLNPPAYQESF
jgi:hypothetical protein